eukprot:Gb_21775 [translate_table: standard]
MRLFLRPLSQVHGPYLCDLFTRIPYTTTNSMVYHYEAWAIRKNYEEGLVPRAILNFDGATKGNPGKARDGGWLYNESRDTITFFTQGLLHKSNNSTEYEALIMGLQVAWREGIKSINVRGESKLVINHVQCKWSVESWRLEDKVLSPSKETISLTVSTTVLLDSRKMSQLLIRRVKGWPEHGSLGKESFTIWFREREARHRDHWEAYLMAREMTKMSEASLLTLDSSVKELQKDVKMVKDAM